MAKASEQFRQSDVTIWGMVALFCGGMAVLGANVSALVPQSVLAGLHKTRIEGASVDQLRLDVAGLNQAATQLRQENTTLVTRFALREQTDRDMIQRVGALEVSLPKLIEALSDTAEIDRSSLTASIAEGQTLSYPADGGSVSIRQRPLELPAASAQPLPQIVGSLPALPAPDGTSFGIALGPRVTADTAAAAWSDLSLKLGPLLFGLSPRLVDEAQSTDKRIVVGPITQLGEAAALCTRLERVSISCMPMPFGGTPLSF